MLGIQNYTLIQKDTLITIASMNFSENSQESFFYVAGPLSL